MQKDKFYVYIHTKPNGEHFYVGKGSGNRCYHFRKNRNQHYLNVIQKYGESNIGISIFKCESESNAFEIEIIFIEILRNAKYPMVNQTNGGDGVSGYKQTPEMIKKTSDRFLGKPLSDEHKKKMSISRMGRHVSQETRNKISAAHLGRKKAPFTDAAKKNMAIALIGRPVSELTRLKMSISKTGKQFSDEHIKNLSVSHIGTKWSDKRRKAFEEKKK